MKIFIEKKASLTDEGKRIPRKKGQPARSKKHSDLYTDENPKGTIHGLGFKDEATARASVRKIRNSSRSHAHKIQAAVAMEQRAKAAGKSGPASIYRKFINSMKKKTKAKSKKNESLSLEEIILEELDKLLSEKCWPGYEKKGMKTMFGKRYPNCVKKTKKKGKKSKRKNEQIEEYDVTELLELDEDIFEEQEALDEKKPKKRKKKKTDFSKEKESGLHGWFSRRGGKGKSKGWVDCNTCRKGKGGRKTCKTCGRSSGEKRAKYPHCRPTPSDCGTSKRSGKKSKSGKKG